MRFHRLVVFTVGFFTVGAACATIIERRNPSMMAKFILAYYVTTKKFCIKNFNPVFQGPVT